MSIAVHSIESVCRYHAKGGECHDDDNHRATKGCCGSCGEAVDGWHPCGERERVEPPCKCRGDECFC